MKTKRMKTWFGILSGAVLLFAGCDDIFERDLTGCLVRQLAPGDSVTTPVARQLLLWEPLKGATAYRLRIATPDFRCPEACLLDTLVTGCRYEYDFSREYMLGEYGLKIQPGQGNLQTVC